MKAILTAQYWMALLGYLNVKIVGNKNNWVSNDILVVRDIKHKYAMRFMRDSKEMTT